jgi:hypothetical protein
MKITAQTGHKKFYPLKGINNLYPCFVHGTLLATKVVNLPSTLKAKD